MKKFLFLFFSIFMAIPSIVGAHTGLESSNPTEGQVVTEDLTEINLSFNTEIEALSSMKLLMDGKEVPIEDIKIEGPQMNGTLSQPIENGSYITKWTIVGKDGHVIEGEIPFTVQKEQTEEQAETPAPSEETPESNEEDSQQELEDEQAAQAQEKGNSRSATPITAILIGVVVILGIGLFMLTGKKK